MRVYGRRGCVEVCTLGLQKVRWDVCVYVFQDGVPGVVAVCDGVPGWCCLVAQSERRLLPTSVQDQEMTLLVIGSIEV